jgi:hypothetical protein
MKTIYALFSSAIATVFLTLLALLSTACTPQPQYMPADEPTIPVVPTTLVYSIDAPDGFDRKAIAGYQPAQPETFKIEGKATVAGTVNPEPEAGPIDPSETIDFETNTAIRSEIFPEDMPGFVNAETGNGTIEITPVELPWDDSMHSTEVSVLKALACHAMEGNHPVDESSFFQSENGKVWLYTQIAMADEMAGFIQHVWKFNGVEKHRVTLFVEGPTYRTASYKTMNDKHNGDWTVEILTENGEVLDTVAFEVY